LIEFLGADAFDILGRVGLACCIWQFYDELAALDGTLLVIELALRYTSVVWVGLPRAAFLGFLSFRNRETVQRANFCHIFDISDSLVTITA
jgi:hypothetical protein